MSKRFTSDLWVLIGSHRKRLLIAGAVTFAVFVFLLAYLAYESEKPEFCLNCHIMEPYYNSWKTSNHQNINCLVCHFKPGFQGFIRGKIVAFSQFIRYITVTYGSKPWAEIPDGNCLQAGCHEGAALKGAVEFKKGVSFDHSHHLSGMRRGKVLRCTSCHSQIVQGTHMMVTEAVCYICHFKPEPGQPRDPKLSDCRTCHIQGVSNPLAPKEHALFIERGTDCTKCHFDVIRGEGKVQRARCESCHAAPDILQVNDPEFLHKEHVTNHKVECYQCHDPIEHRLETVEEITHADCGTCHGQRHQLQKTFYDGAADLPFGAPLPGPMAKAHIACGGCHSEMEDGKTTGALKTASIAAHASEKVCDHCHGSGYDQLLRNWNSEVSRRIGEIAGLTRIAESTEKTTDTRLFQVAGKIGLTFEGIQKAHPVHNLGYSASLIDDAQAALLLATSGTVVGGTLTDWLREEMLAFRNAPSCLQECHYGISQQSKYLKNQDRLYPHAPHVNTARIDCGTCHSREIHKVNLPRGYDCIGCHHEKAKEKQCGDCHKIIFDLAKGGLGDYAIVSSQTLECRSCHIGQTGEIVMLNRNACRQCHLDDKTYLSKLEQEREDLARLRAQTHEAVQAKWQSLDFQGLQMAERVRTVERANGIHNYHLAKRIYSKAAESLAGLAVPTSTTVGTASSNSQPRAKGR